VWNVLVPRKILIRTHSYFQPAQPFDFLVSEEIE
jgi:hypothetical protein